jgi:DnaJ-domain-containing protein 1
MRIQTDLISSSATFPPDPSPLILRDSLVSLLRDMFGPDRRVIVVQGPVGTGKTTLLSQFVKVFPYRCFSFFVSKSWPASDPRYFLMDLCEQMGKVLGKKTNRLDETDTDRLQTLFLSFYRQIAIEARKARQPFYFVVDGFEWISENGQERTVIDFLPVEPSANIFFLASSEPGRKLSFAFHPWNIPLFDISHTELYLAEYGLSRTDIHRIHKTCEGMPGYLDAIRRLLVSGSTLQELPSKLPQEVRGIFEIEWERIRGIDEKSILALALLAFSEEPLTLTDIADLVALNVDVLRELIEKTSFLKFDNERSFIIFVSDAYKEFAAQRLKLHRETVENLLLDYYGRNPYDKKSLMLLPTYLAKPVHYDRLKDLISNDYITKGLQESRDIAKIRRALHLAAEQAFIAQDWYALPKFILGNSILKSISTRPVIEEEIKALLELGEFDQAFDIAYQSLLPEDRLQLLARVCNRMQKEAISVSENITLELEQIASEVDPKVLGNRTVEIASLLFDIIPSTAISLIERSTDDKANEQTLDLALAILAIRLRTAASESLQARIINQDLQDFARVYSWGVATDDAEEVIAKAQSINSTSGKLFRLRSWCNANRTNPRAFVVVEKALEIITTDPIYNPSMRTLRQFAEPLKAASYLEILPLIERLDLLKITSLKGPAEEVTRLDLILALLELQANNEKSLNRLADVYLSIDGIQDLDVRCSCLVSLLINLPKIDPDDVLKLKQTAEEELHKEYENLLGTSADHFSVANNLIGVLTMHNPLWALEFAAKLNLEERRDRAYQEILLSYLERPSEKIDFSFIETVLNQISEQEPREVAIVRLISQFEKLDLFSSAPETQAILSQIETLTSAQNRCYACAYAIKSLAPKADLKQLEALNEQLAIALKRIDSQALKVSVCLDVVTIIGKSAPELARSIFEEAKIQRLATPLSDAVVETIYLNCLRLSIRAMAGMILDDLTYKSYREELLNLIRRLPSLGIQCTLISDLALRQHLAGNDQDFRELVDEQLLPYFRICEDQEARNSTLIEISACLYEYDADWTLELLSNLSASRSDKALKNIIGYLITQRPPDDPIEIKSIKAKIDIRTARLICRVIEKIQIDSNIYMAISFLVNALVEPDLQNPRREVCQCLVERDALDIVDKLEKIIDSSLPDKRNIKHKGYVVICRAEVMRLRAAAAKRAKSTISWSTITSDAEDIKNPADKVYVLSMIAQSASSSNRNLSLSLLREAERLIPLISNIIDRADRFYYIAKSYNAIDENQAARTLLRDALEILQLWSWDEKRDEVTEQVLQLANSIDAEFASALTPLVDNPVALHEVQMDLLADNLNKSSQKLKTHKDRPLQEWQALLGKAAWRMLASLNSESGHIKHQKEIGQWLLEMQDGSFTDTFPVVAWAIENTLRQTQRTEHLSESFQGLTDCLQLSFGIAELLLGLRVHEEPIMNLALPENVRLFRAGTRAEALLTLQDWLKNNAKNYVKICDPYFSVADLEMLKYIDSEVDVSILTAWKAQKGKEPGDRSVEELYRTAWTIISEYPPPWTQVTIIGIRSGDSPLHGRFIITDGKGLKMGTSTSGLGLKDDDLRYLEPYDAARIESELINPYLVPELRIYKNERLIRHVFTLS